jgi:hypothetical protein
MLAPIVIFAFNRPNSLKALIESLQLNALFEESEKYIFVDGPRNEEDNKKVAEVVAYAKSITPNVIEQAINKGLGASIIDGVTSIINQYGRAIVLEDDLRLMPGFLIYMNKALNTYRDDSRIIAICGYGLKIKRPRGYQSDFYLGVRSSSWGWGTWADRWNSVDWKVSDFGQFSKDRKAKKAFNLGGSDMYGMLNDYMIGKNNSWAIRFCYSQFKQSKYSVHPFLSLVDNEGFCADATNTRQKYSRFRITKNESLNFNLPDNLQPDESILRQLQWYHSIPLRIYSKIRKIMDI